MDKIIISCIGDSITWGAGSTDPEKISWPAQIQNILGEKFEVLNFGNSGRSLMSVSGLPYFDEELANESLISNPDIVIFMLGTNDAQSAHWNSEVFKTEYPQAIRKYLDLPSQPKVYVMTPPRSYHNATEGWVVDNEIIKNIINPCIKKTASEFGLEVIDIYSLSDGHREFFIEDGVHPNDLGYTQFANYISKHLIDTFKADI